MTQLLLFICVCVFLNFFFNVFVAVCRLSLVPARRAYSLFVVCRLNDCRASSCCGSQALGTQTSIVVGRGLIAPQHVGSFRTRD